MDWWVTRAGQQPVGPVSTEMVIKGISTSMVPPDALVCEVGGQKWRALAEISRFAEALAMKQARIGRGPNPDSERTIMDFPLLPSDSVPPPSPEVDPLQRFDDSIEHTVAERTLGEQEQSRQLSRFDATDDRTVADADPDPAPKRSDG